MKRKLFCDEHTVDLEYHSADRIVRVRFWLNRAEDYKVLELRNWLQSRSDYQNLAYGSYTLDQAFESLINDIPDHIEVHAMQLQVKPNKYDEVWLGRVGYTVDF